MFECCCTKKGSAVECSSNFQNIVCVWKCVKNFFHINSRMAGFVDGHTMYTCIL